MIYCLTFPCTFPRLYMKRKYCQKLLFFYSAMIFTKIKNFFPAVFIFDLKKNIMESYLGGGVRGVSCFGSIINFPDRPWISRLFSFVLITVLSLSTSCINLFLRRFYLKKKKHTLLSNTYSLLYTHNHIVNPADFLTLNFVFSRYSHLSRHSIYISNRLKIYPLGQNSNPHLPRRRESYR